MLLLKVPWPEAGATNDCWQWQHHGLHGLAVACQGTSILNPNVKEELTDTSPARRKQTNHGVSVSHSFYLCACLNPRN